MSFNIILFVVYFANILTFVTADIKYQDESEVYYPNGQAISNKRFILGPPVGWSQWSSWSTCTKPCAGGITSRDRQCVNLGNNQPINELNCLSLLVNVGPRQTVYCNQFECQAAIWSNWGTWTACSNSCGRGLHSRIRSCVNGETRGAAVGCDGDNLQTRGCQQTCQVAQWGVWGSWSVCSHTCGHGLKSRSRQCFDATSRPTQGCDGDSFQNQGCQQTTCLISAWTPWNAWSACSQTCGQGVRTRDRTCVDTTGHVTLGCAGQNINTQACNDQTCLVAQWAAWSTWSTCSQSCGSGTKSRSRACVFASGYAGQGCAGNSNENTVCKQTCTNMWGAWTAWSTCSGTCGTGIQIRYRKCDSFNCLGEDSSRQVCIHPASCPAVTSATMTTKSFTTLTSYPVTTTAVSTSAVKTSKKPVTTVCKDQALCSDPHTRNTACDDKYIAANFCPKMCGICGVSPTTPSLQCTDKAGSKCNDSIYRHFACADTELKDLCAKTCKVCH